MEVEFTRHAKRRMKWRGITTEEVLLTVRKPDKEEQTALNKYNLYKQVGPRRVKVSCVWESDTWVVITALIKD